MEILAENEEVGKRLDVFLLGRFPNLSRSNIQNNLKLENSYLLRKGKKIYKAGEILKRGDVVFFNPLEPKEVSTKPQDVPFEIVYEDDDLAVVNKPQGVVVHPCLSCPEGTLVNGLLLKIKNLSSINGEIRPGIVHRLDKETCGLMLIAKNDFAHANLSKQISEKTCKRNYLALIEGAFKQPEGSVETLIGRDRKDRKKMGAFPLSDTTKGLKRAKTNYRTVEYFSGYSLVEFSLETGRTHQIRVHSKYLNHPIVGDLTYGGAKKFGLSGQFLCAYKISFIHPRTKENLEFKIRPPENFLKILNNLKK